MDNRFLSTGSAKTARISVPAETGIAILPRDLTQYMDDDSAGLVRRRAPHKRYEKGLLLQSVLVGAGAFAKQVKQRKDFLRESAGRAARYSAEDIGYGLRDFFSNKDLALPDLVTALSNASPVVLPVGIVANSALRNAVSKSHARNHTARQAGNAVSAARTVNDLFNRRPLKEVYLDGRARRKLISNAISKTPKGSPVSIEV